ncbi:MAG: hypothetical protein EWV89_04870 [Microcystis wesenbergii Mw_QC_B_20070930_S4]|nr:MAG: hypothetical protein EWV73_13540 [Microcystis wesenbergii Mw_QC_B_20070930_S4D]TRV16702.1 MAG: hypothetical protein EWV89_04870 [Microcystis wesenbergii Mw_QC_B_20070930_S4]
MPLASCLVSTSNLNYEQLNIRLFVEPCGYLNRLKAWLCVFFAPRLIHYFSFLYTQLNRLINSRLETVFTCHFCFSVPETEEGYKDKITAFLR